MEAIQEHIQYWIDYKGTGDKYRSKHDMDCVLSGGNLLADALISLWLPFKYALDYCGTKEWVEYRDSCSDKSPKDDDEFLYLLKENLETYIPDIELLSMMEELFNLGRTKANVIILPYRRWNRMRGMAPYWDYMPHFLYDMLNTEDENFKRALREWIERERLDMFFDGEICKENIRDLCGTGKPCSHSPWSKKFDVNKLISNYISILKLRNV